MKNNTFRLDDSIWKTQNSVDLSILLSEKNDSIDSDRFIKLILKSLKSSKNWNDNYINSLINNFNNIIQSNLSNWFDIDFWEVNEEIITSFLEWKKLEESDLDSIYKFIEFSSKNLFIELNSLDKVDKEVKWNIDLSNLNEKEILFFSKFLSKKWIEWDISIDSLNIWYSINESEYQKSSMDIEKWEKTIEQIKSFVGDLLWQITNAKEFSNILSSESTNWSTIEFSVANEKERNAEIEKYINDLLDLNKPLDKWILKTRLLDFSHEEQIRIIKNILENLFPQSDFYEWAKLLNVFPNIWRGERWIQFWKSISEAHFKNIVSQDNGLSDKFLTLALKRTIWPIRFLLIKRDIDFKYESAKYNEIKWFDSNNIVSILDKYDISNFDSSSIEGLSASILNLNDLKLVKSIIIEIFSKFSYQDVSKMDLSNIDEFLNKYIDNRNFRTPISTLLNWKSSLILNKEKALEISMWIIYLYNLSCIYDQMDYDKKETKESVVESKRIKNEIQSQKWNEKIEISFENADFLLDVIREIDYDWFDLWVVDLQNEINEIKELYNSLSEEENTYLVEKWFSSFEDIEKNINKAYEDFIKWKILNDENSNNLLSDEDILKKGNLNTLLELNKYIYSLDIKSLKDINNISKKYIVFVYNSFNSFNEEDKKNFIEKSLWDSYSNWKLNMPSIQSKLWITLNKRINLNTFINSIENLDFNKNYFDIVAKLYIKESNKKH